MDCRTLAAEKSILLGVIQFAIDIEDHYDRLEFLRSWNEGSADTDEEWKDWQDFKKSLVLNGKAANQPL